MSIVDSSGAGEVLVEPSGVLQPTDAQTLPVPHVDRQHDAFDEHLRQQHVHFGHDVGDHLHVLLVGKDDQGVGAFVRDDAGIGEQLDLAGAGGPVEDLLQLLLECGTARCRSELRAQRLVGLCGLRLGIRAGAGAQATAVRGPAAGAEAAAGDRDLARTPLLCRRGARAWDGCSAAAACPGDQRVHGVEQIGDLAVFDGDNLQFVIGLRHHVHLLDQFEHAPDVGHVVAQNQELVGIDGDNASRVFGERSQELGHFRRFGGLQLHQLRGPFFCVREFFFGADAGAFLRRLGRRDGFHEFFPLRDHGDAVQRQRAVQRVDGFLPRQRRVIDEGDAPGQTGGTQDVAPGQLGIFLEDLIHRRVEEFERNIGGFGLIRTVRIGGRRRRSRQGRGIIGRRGSDLRGDVWGRLHVRRRGVRGIGGGAGQRKGRHRDQVGVCSRGPILEILHRLPPRVREIGCRGRHVGGGGVGAAGCIVRGGLGGRRNLGQRLSHQEGKEDENRDCLHDCG